MKKWQIPYLYLVGALGLVLVLWATVRFQAESPWLFAFLLLLIMASQIASNVSQHIKITFGFSHAIILATIALVGLPAAILAAVVDNIALWLFNNLAKRPNWRGSCQQLLFNIGMQTTAVFLAGLVLLAGQLWLPDPVWGQAAAWLATAVVYDQANIALLSGIIYLQGNVSPLLLWQSQKQAMGMNIALGAIGGLLMTVAAKALGLWGIMLFLLPLCLAIYAIHLYISESNKQLAVIQKQADELSHTNQRLETWTREKARFMTVLSHDMRTSLNAIRLYSETLHEQPNLSDEKRRKMVQVIRLSEHDLAAAVDNILEVEQMQAGETLKINLTTFDLANLVQDAISLVEMQAASKEITMTWSAEQLPLTIEADRRLLLRVLTNLLSNGVKYTPKGGSLAVQLGQNSQVAHIDITDTGYGIPADELPNIFTLFYRVPKHERQAPGTGLGLAIVKYYVEAHRGQVTVTSQEGKGSTFSIELPKQHTQEVVYSLL